MPSAVNRRQGHLLDLDVLCHGILLTRARLTCGEEF